MTLRYLNDIKNTPEQNRRGAIMPRPSKSIKWPICSPVTIDFHAPEILKIVTDAKGCARTNQRGLAGKHAYVVLGYCIESPDIEIWTCIIDSRGTVSSIGAENAGKEVSVIVL
jgi:hypothetical protein